MPTAHGVTERLALPRELERRPLHETLTGLSNRALLVDRFAQARFRGRCLTCYERVENALARAAGGNASTISRELGRNPDRHGRHVELPEAGTGGAFQLDERGEIATAGQPDHT